MTTAADGHAASIRDIASLREITPDMLREIFTGWHIFRNAGAWWATRAGEQKLTGPESLIKCVICAPEPAELTLKLCLQEHLDGLDAAELEAVYREMRSPEVFR
jgi:hypothetical protein